MKNKKSPYIPYILGGVALVAIVVVAIVAGNGELLKGNLAGKNIFLTTPPYAGMCLVRAQHTPMPAYSDPNSGKGKGYVKSNQNGPFSSYSDIDKNCSNDATFYSQLASTFCLQNPGVSYQKQYAVYELNAKNTYVINKPSKLGADYTPCPAVPLNPQPPAVTLSPARSPSTP